MKRKWLPLIPFFILIPSTYNSAKNDLISATYQQTRSGRYCGEVTRDEAIEFAKDCDKNVPNGLNTLRISANEAIEQMVFAEAGERQIQRDRCLEQSLQALRKGKNFEHWLRKLVVNWLGLKKAQLMRQHCEALFFRSMEPADIERYGWRKAYEMARKRSPRANWQQVTGEVPAHLDDSQEREQWEKVCFDPETRSSLFAAELLFQYTLPVLSSKDFFNTVEKHRDIIINKTTQKPLTDSELLNMDLRDLSNLTIGGDIGKFTESAKEDLRIHEQERREAAEGLEALKSNNWEDLDSETKSLLWEEGIAPEVMLDHNLIKKGEDGQVTVSTAASCILSWYEPSLAGDSISFATSFLGWAGATYKVFNFISTFKNLNKVRYFSKYQNLSGPRRLGMAALIGGTVGTGVEDVVAEFQKLCLSKARDRHRAENTEKDETLVSHKFNSFPDELSAHRRKISIYPDSKAPKNYDLFQDKYIQGSAPEDYYEGVFFSKKDVPACVGVKNYILNESDADCYQLVFEFLPLQLALPSIVLYQSM